MMKILAFYVCASFLAGAASASSLRASTFEQVTGLGGDQRCPGCCTQCDMFSSPEDAGHPGKLVFCQPGKLTGCQGAYTHRDLAVDNICDMIQKNECVNLDNLICPDNTNCLKWGDDGYLGRALIPAGLHIHAYGTPSPDGGWRCQGPALWESPVTTDLSQRWDFYNYDSRQHSFYFSLEDGYACDNSDPKNNRIVKIPGANETRFKNYAGKWVSVGSGAGISITEERSWEDTRSKATTNAFTASYALSITETAGFVFDGAALTETFTASYSTSITETLSHMEGGKIGNTCTNAMKCGNGHLFQWSVTADRFDDGVKVGSPYSLKTCDFVCIDSERPGDTVPQCPVHFCNLEEDCQCCNTNRFYNKTADQEKVPLCNNGV